MFVADFSVTKQDVTEYDVNILLTKSFVSGFWLKRCEDGVC